LTSSGKFQVRAALASRLRFTAVCLLVIGMAGVAAGGFRSTAREAAGKRVLADYFRVERLPASARDIECRDLADSCDPGNSSTICFVRIEPRDFELLASQAHFRKNERSCPENFSDTHLMDLRVGPNFRINEEQWGGSAEARVAVYPDAAHSRFVAVLSRPSALQCMVPATTTSVVWHRLR